MYGNIDGFDDKYYYVSKPVECIMANFRKNGHIDPDLFDVFVRQGVYRRYAEQFLDPAQIDAVDEAALVRT